MRKLTLLVIGFLFSLISSAYPISPRPLRLLVMESEWIITGKVIRITETANSGKNNDYWGSATAVIHVTGTLKGSGIKDTIHVLFEPGMICPAPAQFFENTNVVVFLDRTKGRYYVHALSYGAKTLDEEGVAVYTERINEMLEILEIPEGNEKNEETLEWLVKCAENRYTRWEGSYELHPESDFMSYYSNGDHKNFKYYLSESQLERLKQALLQSEEFDYANLPLVDLVYRHNEKEIDLYLEKALSQLTETQYWMAGEIMKRLQHKVNQDEFREITTAYGDALYTKGSIPEMKKVIERFVAVLK